MANITSLTELTEVADDDLLVAVDKSDTTMADSGTDKKVKKSSLAKSLLDFFYPVGTIYETTSGNLDTVDKMNTHFGGTWEAYGSGRVLVAKSADAEFDTIGETGGVKTVTLTAAQSGLRSHRHQIRLGSPLGIGGYNDKVGRVAEGSTSDDGFRTGTAYATTSSYGSNGYGSSSLDNADATSAHNNLQPYIVVFRYRRTA